MNRESLPGIFIILAASIIVAGCARQEQARKRTAPAERTPAVVTSDTRVPAHYKSPPGSLPSPLPAERFTGPTRSAYQVAKMIPQTLAQLPCYCHCDQSIGHKSLYSCFVDEHASQCAVCVREALTAYQLQNQGLAPEQIRERIIAEYSAQ
jgi:hypothetical protein